jgi:hypothetical protein
MRGIQYAAAFRFNHGVSGILDRPHTRAMTPSMGSNSTKHTSAFPRRVSPGLCKSFRPSRRGRRERRVLAAPAVSCAKLCEETHTSIQVQSEHPGIPCAMVLRLMPRSPRRRIRLVTVIGELTVLSSPVGPTKTSADLTPATGARTTRFCRTQPPVFANRLRPKPDFGGSRKALRALAPFVWCAPIAHGKPPCDPRRARRCRVHRIPSQRS